MMKIQSKSIREIMGKVVVEFICLPSVFVDTNIIPFTCLTKIVHCTVVCSRRVHKLQICEVWGYFCCQLTFKIRKFEFFFVLFVNV